MMRCLSIPSVCRDQVKSIIRATVCLIYLDLEFDACFGLSMGGNRALMEEFSDDAQIVYNSINVISYRRRHLSPSSSPRFKRRDALSKTSFFALEKDRDKINLMHKPRNSQRKDTMRARQLHRDAEHTMYLMRGGERVLPTAILDVVIQKFEMEDEEGVEVEHYVVEEYDVE